MTDILWALIVLLVILAALHGYGHRIVSFALPRFGRDAGISIAVGLAFYNVLAGLMEVSCSASPTLLIVFVVIGLLSFGISIAGNFRFAGFPHTSIPAVVVFACFAFLLAAFLVNAAYWNYNFIDDRMGYLVFPRRILVEGCIGRDQFQFRRVEAGLGGGGAYNYALFQAFVNVVHTRLTDLGIGSVCLLLMVHHHAKEMQLRPLFRAVALLLGLCVIVFSPIINNTPETIGKVMIYALLRVASASYLDPPNVRRGAVIALLFCCLALLKTSYIPPATGIVVAFYGVLLFRGSTLLLLKEGLSSALCLLVFMMPWMWVSYGLAHTAWYPVLGTGTLGDAEVSGFASLDRFVRDSGRIAVILLAPCLIALVGWKYGLWARLSPLMLAIPLVTAVLVLLAQTKFTVFGYRYGHIGAATLFLFYAVISMSEAFRRLRPMLLLSAYQLVVVGLLLSNNTLGYRWFYDGHLAYLVQGKATPPAVTLLSKGEIPEYQLAIPQGEHFLALVSWPSLIDPGRNQVSIMDWPGMIGPPGMPALNDVQNWKRYLSGLGIKYVAYSYGDEAAYPDAQIARDIAAFSEPQRFSQFQIDLVSHFRAVKHLFLAAKGCSRVIYDDGLVVVFDVASIDDACALPR